MCWVPSALEKKYGTEVEEMTVELSTTLNAEVLDTYLPREPASNPRRPSFPLFYLSRVRKLHYFPLLATFCKGMLDSIFMATVLEAHILYYCL